MRSIYIVRRADVDYLAHAFENKPNAEEWIKDNITPAYRNKWIVVPLNIYTSLEETTA